MNIKTNSPTITVSGSGTSSTWTTLSGSYGATGSSGVSGTTTTIASVGGTFSSGSGFGSFVGYHTTISKIKYHVLGKDIEVSGSYKDATTALYVSLVNIHGKQFYDEVKKQGVDFPTEIEEYLKVALISWERDKKLNILL